MKNVHGFSPNQLVLGKNLNFENVCDDRLPASENKTTSEIVAKNLNALHQARQNHIQSESSSKIKLALKKVLAYSDIIYNTGDLVCYKWKDNLNLKETFSVIGRGRQQVLVTHGSRYIRVYPCNLQLSKNSIFGNKDSFPSNIDSSTSS